MMKAVALATLALLLSVHTLEAGFLWFGKKETSYQSPPKKKSFFGKVFSKKEKTATHQSPSQKKGFFGNLFSKKPSTAPKAPTQKKSFFSWGKKDTPAPEKLVSTTAQLPELVPTPARLRPLPPESLLISDAWESDLDRSAAYDYEKAIAVVSRIEKKEQDTPFPRHGRFHLRDGQGRGGAYTGLPMPIFDGTILKTEDHRISLILKSPGIISLDRHTFAQVELIDNLGHIVLTRGQMRLNSASNGSPYVVETGDSRVYVPAGSDVVINRSEALNLTVYALTGKCEILTGNQGALPFELEQGNYVSVSAALGHYVTVGAAVGEPKAIGSEISEHFATVLPLEPNTTLSNYTQAISAAQSFHAHDDLNWPMEERYLNGVSCPFCSYVFSEGEGSKTYCPECYNRLQKFSLDR